MALFSLPALLVMSGLAAGAAPPAPAPDLAEAQVRATNHRFVGATVDVHGDLMESLTHEDFLLTDADGAWRTRAEFIAVKRRQAPLPVTSDAGMQVRLFGAVAVVHGVFTARGDAGRPARVRYTDVHVWSDGAWRLVSVQHTPLAHDVPVRTRSSAGPAPLPWRGRDPVGDDASVLHALNEGYVRAFRDADVAWYGAHLAPDYLLVSGDGALWDRAAALARFAQPTFAASMRSFPVDNITVRRFHDVALVHAENAYELKDGRKGVSRYTDIWHKRDGRWLCIAAHISVQRAPSL